MTRRHLSTVAALVLSAPSFAALHMPGLFGDNMVLQQGPRTPVYGEASPREIVTVTFGTHIAVAMADDLGKWRVELPLIKTDTAIELKIASADETVTYKNVVVGEVWVCGGQSNMEWSYHDAKVAGNAPKFMPDMKRPDIRLFSVKHAVSPTPLGDVRGKWLVCSPESVNDFSLLGFYFGINLADRLKLPVGLIDTSWGGTPAESWTSKRALARNEVTAPLINSMAPSPLGAGKESGRPKIERKASVLYNGMVAPVLGYGFKGVIWYQGESNVGRAEQYKTLFPALIGDWRKEAKREFPFLFVQLANYTNHQPPEATDWALLRDAQKFALQTVLRTGMVTTIDLADPQDIHSPRRDELGRRLSWVALNRAYDQRKSPALGPTYKNHIVEGNQVRIQFDNKMNGLVVRSYNGLSGFEIAGPDKVWQKAFARLERGTVVVYSPKVSTPFAVRYAWRNAPDASFYNTAGLPAVPFRTDDWEIESTQSSAPEGS